MRTFAESVEGRAIRDSIGIASRNKINCPRSLIGGSTQRKANDCKRVTGRKENGGRGIRCRGISLTGLNLVELVCMAAAAPALSRRLP